MRKDADMQTQSVDIFEDCKIPFDNIKAFSAPYLNC